MSRATVGIGSAAGLLIGVLVLVLVLAAVGTFVILIVANRADPDPTGRRPFAVYLFGVSFITLWTALIGSAAMVAALVQLIGSHRGSSFSGALHPIGDASARGAVLGGLITVVSVAALVVHLRKGLALREAQPSAPCRRVAHSYVAAVSFVSVLIVLAAAVVVVYSIFRIAGPGVFGSGAGRTPSVRFLIDALYLGAAAAAIFFSHRTLVEMSPSVVGGPPAPSPMPPPPPSPPSS